MRASQRPPPTGPLVWWRDPEKAQAWGWVAALGAGPFEVVSMVDHSGNGLRPGLVLKTRLGEYEVSECWVQPAGPLE